MFIFNMILPASIDGIYKPIIKHIFKEKYFSTETNKIIDTLTSATIGLWNRVKSTMLPTPTKFHYVFNMRELSRIFKGILLVRKDIINSSSTIGIASCKPEVFLVGLWRHECERVFADKMINNKDKD
jgi:dynein heavy chain